MSDFDTLNSYHSHIYVEVTTMHNITMVFILNDRQKKSCSPVQIILGHVIISREVLKYELGTDVQPKVSTTTL